MTAGRLTGIVLGLLLANLCSAMAWEIPLTVEEYQGVAGL